MGPPYGKRDPYHSHIFRDFLPHLTLPNTNSSPLETSIPKRHVVRRYLNFRVRTTSESNPFSVTCDLLGVHISPPQFLFISIPGVRVSNRLGKQDQSNQLLQLHNESSILEESSSALLAGPMATRNSAHPPNKW